ncbi:zinc ribbon domain-containing protein [Nocardioides sambongensis]|uniref:hypothetical protein n=1 Tax=Nocardioides sambongensis TaxID=2589074 RepID=UPI001127F584|nr:hypothetical protein [Nocardioides sambongensis]
MNCPSCGTPADQPGQRFCRACGTSLTAPVAPPSPPPGPTLSLPFEATAPAEQPAGWRRAVLPVLGVLVAASIGIGGTLLLLGGPGEAAADRTPAEAGATATAADPTGPVPPASSTSSTRTARPPGAGRARFECWDGSRVASADRCPALNGTDGMAWVFPGSEGPGCRRAGSSGGRGVEVNCTEQVGGREVEVHYSRWRSWESMDRNYRDAATRSLDLRRDVNARAVASERVAGKVAVWLADRSAPYSVTIYADRVADAVALFGSLDVRGRGELTGPGRH